MIIILFFAGVIIVIVYRFQQEIGIGYKIAERKAAPARTWVLPVPQLYKDILQKYFQYYQLLPASQKAKFERKVCTFIYSKQFIPRNIDEVTIEAKVLIAASAVQLTFGLPNIYLQHFDKILVYPNDYYSSITKRYHKGEVNPRFGIIVLSWQSFVDGYIDNTDHKNLGLHEMAHALRLENVIRNDEYQFFDAALLERFDQYAHDICSGAMSEGQTFFRPYACTNEHEFFSVAIENFFERPHQFKEEMPILYGILTDLLKQDPIRLSMAA